MNSLKKTINNRFNYYKYNFFKYNYNYDILNNDSSKNMSLLLDFEYILDNILNNKKFSIKMFSLKQSLKREFAKLQNINVIFDKTFDELDENTTVWKCGKQPFYEE